MWTLHLQQEREGCSLNRFCKQLREAGRARGGVDTGVDTGTGTSKDKDKDTIEVEATGTTPRRGAGRRRLKARERGRAI